MRKGLLVLGFALSFVLTASAQSPNGETELRQIEEQFLAAKLKQDISTLDRIHHRDYYGTNQAGRRRNKAQVLELWKTFTVKSLTNEISRIQISGNVAVVNGRMFEVSGTSDVPLLFTRVYVQEDGRWQLLSNTQSIEAPVALHTSSARVAPVAAATAPNTRFESSGLSFEAREIRAGGSCVVVVSRRDSSHFAVAPCN